MLVVYKSAKDQKGQAGVGVDVMRIDQAGVDAKGLEEVLIEQGLTVLHQLHPSELAVFRTTPQLTSPTPHSPGAETARLNYLIRMWTAKEAYAKAIGTGLGTEFKEISLVGLDHLDIGEVESAVQ
ncbi:hypothetical protein QFC22_001889 [Naganishia vaughanmartiniae]|uniref:Uncharacterized protein n=1 Tax=Naganishia vaughanmartiniae TaxID=1424756 RepID=A0ACC2XFQ0_9TREE|nr:hypothetical protein QFC22_001889 [Naganishia vaughanmartiniae]